MSGMFGAALVIAQMAGLALGFPTSQIMAVGLLAAISWCIRAINNKDNWLLFTNLTVGGFAIYGLVV